MREAEAVRHSHELEQMLDNLRLEQHRRDQEQTQRQQVHLPTKEVPQHNPPHSAESNEKARLREISTAISVVKPTLHPSASSGSPRCL